MKHAALAAPFQKTGFGVIREEWAVARGLDKLGWFESRSVQLMEIK